MLNILKGKKTLDFIKNALFFPLLSRQLDPLLQRLLLLPLRHRRRHETEESSQPTRFRRVPLSHSRAEGDLQGQEVVGQDGGGAAGTRKNTGFLLFFLGEIVSSSSAEHCKKNLFSLRKIVQCH